MQPRRTSLLRCIQKTVGILANQVPRPELQALLEVIRTCANELQLREAPEFYLRYHDRGAALARSGAQLLGEAGGGLSAAALVDAGTHPDALDSAIRAVSGDLERILSVVGTRETAEIRGFVRECREWELSLYQHRLQQAEQPRQDGLGNERFTRDNLQQYLRDRSPDIADLRVTDFRSVPGGFSKFTVVFATSHPIHGCQEFVARIEPPATFWDLPGLDVRKEYPVVQLAFRSGLPVAEPLWLEGDATRLGLRFFVSRKMPGTIYGTVKEITRDIPEEIIAKLAQVLADLHRAPLDRNDPLIRASHLWKWLEFPTLSANTRAAAQEWGEQLTSNRVDPSPLVRQALDWLIANPPADDGPCALIHGDFGLHNILIDQGELTAVLDWETSRVGDPAEEFGHFFSGLGGRIDPAHFMRLYREAGGRQISEYQLRYFDVFDSVQLMVACLVVLARLDNLERPNVAWSVFGLQYMHHYANRFAALIEAAEAARGR